MRLESNEVLGRVRRIAERVALSRGLEVVDVEFGRGRGSHFVRVSIDRSAGGVDVADLQSASEEISAIMDVDDLIDSAYRLEVSSPGLDRPLRNEADFRRCIGRRVSVCVRDPIEGRRNFEGYIVAVDARAALFKRAIQDEETTELPFTCIDHARLLIDFAHGRSRHQKRRGRNKR
jgi:ribosome maturation factor RimP